MAQIPNTQIKAAHVEALRREFASLAERGVWVCGNVFSSIVLVKGELDDAERTGSDLMGGADGVALRAALGRLGYAPEDFCALASCGDEGPLEPALFREALEALDPEAVVAVDDAAADELREAYAEELALIEDFNTAALMPGLVAPVMGRRMLALDGFEAALTDSRAKQRMWAYLKQLPPEGAPY